MNHTVLVTGAAHGIGRATATKFAMEGRDVVVTDVDIVAAHAVRNAIGASGGRASAHELDVARPDSWDALARELTAADRLPAVVVNNAFALLDGRADELSEDEWNFQLSVSVSSVYRSVHTFHRSLRQAGGSVVNVSSVHALLGWPRRPAYAAAKGAIVSLTRQLSVDYAPQVRVNCVLPGSVLTRVWDDMPEDERQREAVRMPLRRFGAPDEIASVIAFLASDAASYVTGAAIVVDGGLSSAADTGG